METICALMSILSSPNRPTETHKQIKIPDITGTMGTGILQQREPRQLINGMLMNRQAGSLISSPSTELLFRTNTASAKDGQVLSTQHS